MQYRYRFKNPQLEKAVFALFDEDSIKKSIDNQIKEKSNIISLAEYYTNDYRTRLHKDLQQNLQIVGRIDFAKSELEVIPDYDPNGWNPYPEITPP